MSQDGYAQYQQNQFLTLSPAKLLLAAYDGAIRFCRIGAEKMKAGQLDEQSLYISKALAVVGELMTTLREEIDPSLVGRLRSIYCYVMEKLAHANLNQDEQSLNEAIKILSELRETWAEAERIIQNEHIQEEAA